MKMHADEVDTSVSLVRELIDSQYPQWTGLPISRVAAGGTEHALYRLGDDLVVRMPFVATGAGQAKRDLALLPRIAPHVPLAVPVPLALGEPALGYPFTWSVYPWLPGTNATTASADPHTLAEFVLALQRIDTADGPAVNGRGGPLAPRAPYVRAALAQPDGVIDTAAAWSAWQRSLAAPEWDRPPVWLHGDLHAANLLVHEGRLSAVIDWGCVAVGDPAVDLLPAWGLLSVEARPVFRSSLDVDDATWERGRGWALSIGLIALPYYATTNPVLAGIARQMIDAVLAG
ncbi:phosphotransferase [Lentzea sp. NBRC 105346]|uniref:aminoglycoside phosphotransferase family protein n=1 Tax=Lentzea sp. NBRC 105346 TaxID=3032205 RepID=UPI0024A2C2D7|nr:aminoglycoside phosphotransferase family protein [Lentzea sp. NBRC 105346]GLZ29040.1 phosphotransferase [Lentzea sp. NBRC 105346]